MARLVATKGAAAGTSFPVGKVATVGRSLEVDVRLEDPTVSRVHTRLTQDENGDYYVEDLQSGNGTFVNNVKADKWKLKEGDEIRLGNNVLVFHVEAHPAAGATGAKTMLDVTDERIGSTVLNSIAVEAGSSTITVSDQTTIEELAAANRRLQVVCEMFHAIGTDLNKDELLQKILDTLFRIFPDTHRGFIVLRDPATGELTPYAKKTISASIDDRLAISETILQYVFDKAHAVLSKDAMHDGRFTGSQSIAELQMHSVMCAPLKHEGNILGFISLDTQRVSEQYDEDGLALLAGIANQASLSIANARMHGELMARQRIEQDLQNARHIQHSFLPQKLPEVEGYEFADFYMAAYEVGGDFYDFIPMPGGKLGIVVGDVSGKGITAALMMAKMTGHVRVYAASGMPPSKLLAELNSTLLSAGTELFATVLFMVLDPDGHSLIMGSAGHQPPLIRRADGTVEVFECTTGFPVGLIDDGEFPEFPLQLQREDRALLSTDGLAEAMNEVKEPYGDARLLQTLKSAPLAPAAMVEHIRNSIGQYIGDAKQSDDLTLVCFGPS